MPLDLPEVSSPFDVAPEALCDSAPSIAARALLLSELRRTFSYFSLFLNAFRDRATAAANGGDSCIKSQWKLGHICGMKLLLQCSKEHSKVMEAVIGSVSRLIVCVAAVMGDLQSQTLHEHDLFQSFIDCSRSVGNALHKWSIFAHELWSCIMMLLPDGAADPHASLSSSATIRGFSMMHRSLASLTSIAREVPMNHSFLLCMRPVLVIFLSYLGWRRCLDALQHAHALISSRYPICYRTSSAVVEECRIFASAMLLCLCGVIPNAVLRARFIVLSI